MKKASYWEAQPEKVVLCLLCPQYCKITPGNVGVCRARKNVAGQLVSLNYGEVTSFALDPIEKKPLYHFYPGSEILSVGTKGCNLSCGFCQNWQISQADAETYSITPAGLAEIVLDYGRKKESVGLSYTYSEPLIWFEFVLETAGLVREKGFKNVLVTNGHVNKDPLKELLPYIDAMNIDVKSFSPEFYGTVCHGKLEPVLRTAELAREEGCHIEITNLVIPGMNDSEDEIAKLVKWVAEALGDTTPLHFSRYYPAYEFSRPPTPIQTLRKASDIAKNDLKYVYLGNVPGMEGCDTVCYECGKKVIERTVFGVARLSLRDAKCKYCGAPIHIIQS
jgi:pyruvate formate lyase activating enzyme